MEQTQLTQEQIINNLVQNNLILNNKIEALIADYILLTKDYKSVRQDYLVIRYLLLEFTQIKPENLEEFEKIKNILVPAQTTPSVTTPIS